jgi:hypothetical protein
MIWGRVNDSKWFYCPDLSTLVSYPNTCAWLLSKRTDQDQNPYFNCHLSKHGARSGHIRHINTRYKQVFWHNVLTLFYTIMWGQICHSYIDKVTGGIFIHFSSVWQEIESRPYFNLHLRLKYWTLQNVEKTISRTLLRN